MYNLLVVTKTIQTNSNWYNSCLYKLFYYIFFLLRTQKVFNNNKLVLFFSPEVKTTCATSALRKKKNFQRHFRPEPGEGRCREEPAAPARLADPPIRPSIPSTWTCACRHKQLILISHKKEVRRTTIAKVFSALMDAFVPCDFIQSIMLFTFGVCATMLRQFTNIH